MPEYSMPDPYPGRFHQFRVHRVAKRYLALLSRVTGNLAQFMDLSDQLQTDRDSVLNQILARVELPASLRKLHRRFDAVPLYGTEVLDEALVLIKNDPNRWKLSPLALGIASNLWRKYDAIVTRERGGSERPTTSPTLRGGGRRPTPHQWRRIW